MPKITIQEDKSNNKAELNISGDVVLDAVPEILPKLKAASDKFREIHLLMEEVTQIDMSGIQLILAIEKKMRYNNKVLKIFFKPDEEKQKIIKNSGFSHIVEN